MICVAHVGDSQACIVDSDGGGVPRGECVLKWPDSALPMPCLDAISHAMLDNIMDLHFDANLVLEP